MKWFDSETSEKGNKIIWLYNNLFLNFYLLQAPDRFVVAAARNPVCNVALMVGTSDIPDWCYTEAYGKEGKNYFSEVPTIEQLSLFYKKSPISHLQKVCGFKYLKLRNF